MVTAALLEAVRPLRAAEPAPPVELLAEEAAEKAAAAGSGKAQNKGKAQGKGRKK